LTAIASYFLQPFRGLEEIGSRLAVLPEQFSFETSISTREKGWDAERLANSFGVAARTGLVNEC
jgi:hypothetical protein